jgi:hypothetical protein
MIIYNAKKILYQVSEQVTKQLNNEIHININSRFSLIRDQLYSISDLVGDQADDEFDYEYIYKKIDEQVAIRVYKKIHQYKTMVGSCINGYNYSTYVVAVKILVPLSALLDMHNLIRIQTYETH